MPDEYSKVNCKGDLRMGDATHRVSTICRTNAQSELKSVLRAGDANCSKRIAKVICVRETRMFEVNCKGDLRAGDANVRSELQR
jgi:hypothetical protein